MSARLAPYPEYKESGLPWLGKIPAHWHVLPSRAVFAEVIDRNHPDEALISVTIGKGVIRQSDLLADSSKKDSSNENKASYKLVQPGDIAYNKMRAWQGAVGISKYRGIVSPAYIVVRPRSVQNPVYFHYLLRTPAFAKEAERWSYGITSDQWSLRPEDFKRIYCPLLPQEEQDRIVRFLAWLDRRINRLIRAKRRLIKLLEEQKQAIIHQAVTRGLDPNVRLKPSGIDWLGDTPENWNIARLRNIATVVLGKMLKTSPAQGDELKPYLRSANIQWLQPKLDDVAEMWFSSREMETLRLRAGDVLVSEGGEVGRACLWSDELPECFIQNSVHKVTPHAEMLSEYLLYQFFLMGKSGYFESVVNRVSIGHLTREKLVDVRFAVPPEEEQNQIIKSVEQECSTVDGTIDRASREIALIREYRTRLIADVVTGKLDVRGVELPALDEADALEDLDIGEDADAEEMADIKETADAGE